MSAHCVLVGACTLLRSGSNTLARTHVQVASAMCVHVHCERKYYMWMYETNQSLHARVCTRALLTSTRTLLASAALTAHEHLPHPRELSASEH